MHSFTYNLIIDSIIQYYKLDFHNPIPAITYQITHRRWRGQRAVAVS